MSKREVNNAFYDTLGERWHSAHDDPVALLRAESKLKNPWVLAKIRAHFGERPCTCLDIGCGAGFLTHALAGAGHDALGIDLSGESLKTAETSQPASLARFRKLGSHELHTLPQESFDVVSAMDFLEHVEDPAQVVSDAARLLKPGGLFFFHTFNRNPLSWLVVIKGVEWFVRNTPKDMHVYRLFIRPGELTNWCENSGLRATELHGMKPKILRPAFWHLLRTGIVREDFEFELTRSTLLAYIGIAKKLTQIKE